MQPTIVNQVRSFNRFYTRAIGLLSEHLPDSEFTLAEARVLYELAQTQEQTAADIMRTLDMDKAHISRIVTRFRNASLITSRVSPDHRKQKLISLTADGKKAFRRLNQGTEAQVEALIAPLPEEQRERLAKNMREMRRLLKSESASPEQVKLRSLEPGDLGWIAHRQALLYHKEYDWDWTYEGLVSRILGDFVSQFDSSREDAWVADIEGEIVGSIFLMKSDDVDVAKLRLLFVESSTRGLGIGSRLVKTCVDRACELGYGKITRWTTENLGSARKIYQAAGFRLTEESMHRLFGKDLKSQIWTLDLKGR